MGLLGKSHFAKSRPRKYELVEVPELAEGEATHVRVSALTVGERNRVEDLVPSKEGVRKLSDISAAIFLLAVVDDEGRRVFSDDDVSIVRDLDAAAYDRVVSVAMRLAGWSKEDSEALKKTDDDNTSSD